MGKRRAIQEQERAREFESFVAGAAGRLLHTAQLLTSEPPGAAPAAERLLTAALARTYARWDRLHGEDPYETARQELISRFAHLGWRFRRTSGGLLDRLTPQERLVLVLRLYEGVAEEQTAAALGLPPERVHAILVGATSTILSRPATARRRAPRPEGATT
ncbi:hypothetical protein SRB5_50270 [Streptomyces sp. RB5]|uniref:RNA polymerase sigma-70 region 4 domain-containing protein n=1 Tax=Streptomyces smaragdinus TaxID=2585196 RepID=A0A7K0CN61_9ACTN|nr:sigma factor-like helix-turn-helix DNA-binding protein [Streptomyces smaragdinus]MQY14851.1 hypothetical protein [Streptomyces smaragdinus]